jgi:hypothetical protein
MIMVEITYIKITQKKNRLFFRFTLQLTHIATDQLDEKNKAKRNIIGDVFFLRKKKSEILKRIISNRRAFV